MKKLTVLISLLIAMVFVFTACDQTDEPQLRSASTETPATLDGTWNLTRMFAQTGTAITEINYTAPTEAINVYYKLEYANNTCVAYGNVYAFNGGVLENQPAVNIYFYQIIGSTITWEEENVTTFYIQDSSLYIVTSLQLTGGVKQYIYSVYSK